MTFLKTISTLSFELCYNISSEYVLFENSYTNSLRKSQP